ncbi:ribokinase [Cetobacterium sp. 8H]|uniref:ribokinase n=1 Tax=Cetobacterium sp. 8H TaxID=2759681 RepID=UPI00163D0783|nr:ribokinase [Cetobacterium sp. 8H]MBC2850096.1 ribokinase [Cetobacterium sp. 8H]
MKKIVVVGSINMDLVTICERAPRGGETLLGKKFMQIPGGKGANQAVAIGKMHSDVTMLGKVGKEGMGDILLNSMKNDGVDISNIEYSDESTGIAKIIVEENGQNRILVVPGANYSVDNNYIDRHMDAIKNSDIVVAQLEIPLETVKYVFKKAKELGKITILNPAPAVKLDDEIIANSDYIIPNETELELLSGISTIDDEGVEKAAQALLDKGVKGLIVTLGSKGCMFIDKNNKHKFDAYKVKAIDTTAAGDSFIGGFVNGIASGLTFEESIDRGTKVAAISVTRIGAQTSIPTLEEVLNFKGE